MDFNRMELALSHVVYEIDSVADCHEVLVRIDDLELPDGMNPAVISNAALEAMLVHVRALIEFLVGRPPRHGSSTRRRGKNDIVPMSFAPGWATLEGPHVLDGWLELLDRQLAHLSWDRVPNDNADEPVDGPLPVDWTNSLVEDLLEVLETFVLCTDAAWTPRLRSAAGALRAKLARGEI